MQIDHPSSFLFIEPQTAPTSTPLIDDLTRRMTGAWRQRMTSDFSCKGWHYCTAKDCQGASDTRDHWVTGAAGLLLFTNALAIHYVAFHRLALTRAELDKVAALLAAPAEPTDDELMSAGGGEREAIARYQAAVARHGAGFFPRPDPEE